MTADNLPVLAVIFAMFASFVAVVGFVSVWSNLPPSREQRRAPASASLRADLAR